MGRIEDSHPFAGLHAAAIPYPGKQGSMAVLFLSLVGSGRIDVSGGGQEGAEIAVFRWLVSEFLANLMVVCSPIRISSASIVSACYVV